MRLTWRDAVSTLLVAAGLAMATSVLAAWQWPLLGGVREGIVALTVFGFAACALGSPLDRFSFSDPFGLSTMVVAMAVMAIAVVGGLISGAPEYLSALMGVTGVLWAMATVRHAVEGSTAPGRRVLGS